MAMGAGQIPGGGGAAAADRVLTTYVLSRW